MVGTAAARRARGSSVVSAWLEMGLLSLRPFVLCRGQQKRVGSGQVEQILTFPPEEFL